VLLISGAVSLVLLAPVLREVYASLSTVAHASAVWVAVALACVIAGFASTWALQRQTLRVGRWADVAGPQLAGNAASNLLPVGSAAGSVIQLRMLTRKGIDLTRAVTSLTIAGMLSTVAGLVIFPALVVLPLGNDAGTDVTSAARVGVIGLLVGLPLVVVALRSDRPMRWVATACYNMLRRLPHVRPPADLADRIIAERDAVRDVLRQHLLLVALFSVGRALGDYLALYASLFAVGLRPSPALVLLAFIAANTAGAVPLTPGGLGFVEAGLSGTLLLAGAAEEPSLAAVAIYRLVSNWLPITVGVAAYLWSRKSATLPRVRRTSSAGGAENTCLGVPAAAHTVS
jgi:uncharacterized protein (TIRG00374 family)